MSKYVQLKDPVTGEAVYPIIAKDPNIASFSEVAGSDTVNPMGIAYGGTGAVTVEGARSNLGLGNTSGALPVANGGTGATTAEQARINLGIGTIAFGHYNATTTGFKTDSRTWHYPSHFDGHSYSHVISDDSVFKSDPNGFQVLKSGYYLLLLHSHYNTSASSIQMSTMFYNYTTAGNVGSTMFNVTPVAWGGLANHCICHLNASNKVILDFQKYSTDTTSEWRPSSMQYDIILLKED